MRTITLVFIGVLVAGTWLALSNRHTDKIMSMCADHVTQTLYECDTKMAD